MEVYVEEYYSVARERAEPIRQRTVVTIPMKQRTTRILGVA